MLPTPTRYKDTQHTPIDGADRTTTMVVTADDDEMAVTAAAALARELRLPVTDFANSRHADMALVCTAERVELHDNRHPRVGPTVVDFVARRPQAISRHQPLARSLGAKNHFVADATAGLGADTWMIAALGCRVLAFERNPTVAALLRDGLRRARAHALPATLPAGRVTLIGADARTALLGLRTKPDVVYMDPMFPPKRRKTAAANKEVRAVRTLAGNDEDAAELFQVARGCAVHRVVVKRPDHAPPLVSAPSVSYAGKLVRYDVYFTRH